MDEGGRGKKGKDSKEEREREREDLTNSLGFPSAVHSLDLQHQGRRQEKRGEEMSDSVESREK